MQLQGMELANQDTLSGDQCLEAHKASGKHILTGQKNIKYSKKYLMNIFQSPLC